MCVSGVVKSPHVILMGPYANFYISVAIAESLRYLENMSLTGQKPLTVTFWVTDWETAVDLRMA